MESADQNPACADSEKMESMNFWSFRLWHSSLKPNSLPVSETLLVFIERAERGSGQAQVYRLEMWQVIILPTADAVGSKTPSKKT